MRVIFIASDEEVAEWKRQAKAVRMNFSVFIRAMLNGTLNGKPERSVQPRSQENPVGAGSSNTARVSKQRHRSLSDPVCEHGIERGYRCWQCGGLAKI